MWQWTHFVASAFQMKRILFIFFANALLFWVFWKQCRMGKFWINWVISYTNPACFWLTAWKDLDKFEFLVLALFFYVICNCWNWVFFFWGSNSICLHSRPFDIMRFRNGEFCRYSIFILDDTLVALWHPYFGWY